jgi:hypothetical protein
VLPVLKEEDDFDMYKRLDSTLSKVYPANKHVLALHKRIIEYQQSLSVKKPR